MRAAERPSLAGQYVSSAKTMPSSISTGLSKRVQARDHRRLVEPDAEPVAELQAEARLLAREAELLGGRPHLGDPVGRHPGPHERDRVVEPLAALLVRSDLAGEALPTQNVR